MTLSNLYDQYKNTPKKLKIICGWDEVIQATEPYALWMIQKNEPRLIHSRMQPTDFRKVGFETFSDYFKYFWEWSFLTVEYSRYGSSLKYADGVDQHVEKEVKEDKFEDQQIWKNSPNFYQQAPFLTIAEDLLKLIKEDKVKALMFLSSYDKNVFSDKDEDGDEIGDKRKEEIFEQTFGKLDNMVSKIGNDGRERVRIAWEKKGKTIINFIQSPFDGEKDERGTAWTSKADWIKENASDFDIVIDDNPNICKSLVELKQKKTVIRETDETKIELWKRNKIVEKDGIYSIHTREINLNIEIIAPYYPAVANQHHKEVLLVKNEVSDLKKEDFSK